LINRLAGLVLPASPKLLIDRVIGKHQVNLLMPIALVVVVATLVQAGTTFALSQVMSVAAQRAIAEMRKRVNQHVLRLPVSYFDGTQTGILISRILNDAGLGPRELAERLSATGVDADSISAIFVSCAMTRGCFSTRSIRSQIDLTGIVLTTTRAH